MQKLKNSITFFFVLIFCAGLSNAQNARPKLVVGIVVDQMRNEYIERFWNRFGEGGFKRLVNGGYYCQNAHYNYVPTYTGPGHSSIYTGTTPKYHGIIANEWYNPAINKMAYCVRDDSANAVGFDTKEGKRSPWKQLSTTLGDELKINSNGNSKVFSVALKDRSAILPAGHTADGVFWMEDSLGNFITSTWYSSKLPDWLQAFNNKQKAKEYLKNDWRTLYPIATYTSSIADNNEYENSLKEDGVPTFPYTFGDCFKENYFGTIKETPYGNSITADIAIECLKNESLGKHTFTDMLCISFSSPDILAHSYGPRSVEIEDMYLRLDKEIERLLLELDKLVGKTNYILFLTADHGGAEVPKQLMNNKIPGGYLDDKDIEIKLKNYLKELKLNEFLVLSCANNQVYLDDSKLEVPELEKLEKIICEYLVKIDGIAEAYPSISLKNESYENDDVRKLLYNGYNQKRSGNVLYTMEPAWMDFKDKGTTHGSAYPYDTHVPVIFYGKDIPAGKNYSYITITQIAPTISQILRITYPNACFSNPIVELLKK